MLFYSLLEQVILLQALLTRVAESATGAHTLIQCGLMARLAECSILDVRPEGDTRTNSFIPAVLTRYLQHNTCTHKVHMA